jgi:DNA-binding GntR family transcriptional regulator
LTPTRVDPQDARRSLTQKAYDHVRNAILTGDMAVGTIVGQAELADALAISKTPVRQALQLLHTEGLLEIGPRKQFVVSGLSAGHRNEILRIRESLEAIAVETAARVLTFDQIDALHLMLIKQRRAADLGDEDQFLLLDEEFHVLIARSAGLPIVARLLEQIRGFARLMRLGRVQPAEHLQEVIAEHSRIIEAIERRDGIGAVRELQVHLHHWDSLISTEAP